jgi:hypoxia-inducible factor prolyl hydroxylase
VEQWGLEDMCSNLIRDMNEYGVCVLDNFLGNEKGLKVLDEVTEMHSAGVFKVRKISVHFITSSPGLTWL